MATTTITDWAGLLLAVSTGSEGDTILINSATLVSGGGGNLTLSESFNIELHSSKTQCVIDLSGGDTITITAGTHNWTGRIVLDKGNHATDCLIVTASAGDVVLNFTDIHALDAGAGSNGFGLTSGANSIATTFVKCTAEGAGNDGWNINKTGAGACSCILKMCEGTTNDDEDVSPHNGASLTCYGGRFGRLASNVSTSVVICYNTEFYCDDNRSPIGVADNNVALFFDCIVTQASAAATAAAMNLDGTSTWYNCTYNHTGDDYFAEGNGTFEMWDCTLNLTAVNTTFLIRLSTSAQATLRRCKFNTKNQTATTKLTVISCHADAALLDLEGCEFIQGVPADAVSNVVVGCDGFKGALSVKNCTFFGQESNAVNGGHDRLIDTRGLGAAGGTVTISRNIFYDAQFGVWGTAEADYNPTNSGDNQFHNCTNRIWYGGVDAYAAGNENGDADPLFVRPTTPRDLSLQSHSPAAAVSSVAAFQIEPFFVAYTNMTGIIPGTTLASGNGERVRLAGSDLGAYANRGESAARAILTLEEYVSQRESGSGRGVIQGIL